MFNRLLAVIIVSLLSASHAFSYSSNLEDLPLVESYAKGFAITAEDNDLEGAEKNPATISFDSKKEIIMNINQSYDAGLKQGYFGLGYSLFKGIKVSLTLPFQMADEINETELSNGSAVKLDEFSMMSLQPKLSLKVPVLPFLDLGASLRGYFDTIHNDSSSGFGLDFGALFHFKRFSIGYAAQELATTKRWSTGLKEVFKPSFHTGIKIDVSEKVALLVDITKEDGNFSTNLASTVQLTNRLAMSAGVRDAGYSNQLRAGANLKFNKWKINYAYGHHAALSDSHKMGITIDY